MESKDQTNDQDDRAPATAQNYAPVSKPFRSRWLSQVPSIDLNTEDEHRLRIFNSLTRSKDPLITSKPNTINWYSCGPTVYDVSHLGHARCYITFDIIRRILSDYFGYQVFYVMNITDIDDKIIKRARSNHLCDKYIEQVSQGKKESLLLLQEVEQALESYQKQHSDEKDPAKLEMVKNTVKSSQDALISFKNLVSTSNNDYKAIGAALENLRTIIAEDQDAKLAHTITDHRIFKSLTMKYEQEFHEDMKKLDVLPPDALPRVSEYIEEIGLYIKKIENNGYAYQAGGSVYFDTKKFDSENKHSYAKLVREAYGQSKRLDEGEGALTTAQDDKRSPNDFALWKKSKKGEPTWTTQDYEPGRPGWHIECSAMASKLLGENFDMHSGGCDLKFPHHDNEIAQAEAYYDTGKNWVNYFIHSGHLSVQGCKMSKSLKNFITINQALQKYTSRQLRFAFLCHSWGETLDYSANTLNTAIGYEKIFNKFFLNIANIIKTESSSIPNESNKTESQELINDFEETIKKVDTALCNNFDTRSVLTALQALIKNCNKSQPPDVVLLRKIARYVRHLLAIFGVSFKSKRKKYNQKKMLSALADFRAEVRKDAKQGLTGEPEELIKLFKKILASCDSLRDKTLPELGVLLEDKQVEGVPYDVEVVGVDVINQERTLAIEVKEENLRLKQEQQRQKQQKKQNSNKSQKSTARAKQAT